MFVSNKLINMFVPRFAVYLSSALTYLMLPNLATVQVVGITIRSFVLVSSISSTCFISRGYIYCFIIVAFAPNLFDVRSINICWEDRLNTTFSSCFYLGNLYNIYYTRFCIFVVVYTVQ